MLAFAFASCNKQESSVSSTRTSKLVDIALAEELQKMREESNNEVHQFESRISELLMTLNEEMFKDNPQVKEKYMPVLNAEMQMFQAKAHFDMERSMFIDKMMNQLANANSREEVKKNGEQLIQELRQQSQMYMESCRRLLGEMSNVGMESPLIEELKHAGPHVEGDVAGSVEGEAH